MGLSYCTNCETLEGKWTLPDDLENDIDNFVCGECGKDNCLQQLPEHDDSDMDR